MQQCSLGTYCMYDSQPQYCFYFYFNFKSPCGTWYACQNPGRIQKARSVNLLVLRCYVQVEEYYSDYLDCKAKAHPPSRLSNPLGHSLPYLSSFQGPCRPPEFSPRLLYRRNLRVRQYSLVRKHLKVRLGWKYLTGQHPGKFIKHCV